MVYMIAITEIHLTDTKILHKQIFFIPFKYFNIVYVYLENVVNLLLKHSNHNLCLEKIETPLFKLLYNLFQNKLKIFKKYTIENPAKRFS